jgi:hypothetical protein
LFLLTNSKEKSKFQNYKTEVFIKMKVCTKHTVSKRGFKLIPLLAAILIAMLITGCTEDSSHTADPGNTSDTPGGQGNTQTPSSGNYSWILEPKLDYLEVRYHPPHSECLGSDGGGAYAETNDGKDWVINVETGEKIKEHYGHESPGQLTLGYDTKTQKYFGFDWEGAYPIDDYKKELSDFDSSTLLPVVLMETRGDENHKYAIANKNGLITEFVFDDSEYMYNPLLAVKQNGKWGFVDSSGKFAIEPIFEEAFSFENDRAFVKQNGKWGIIRKGA